MNFIVSNLPFQHILNYFFVLPKFWKIIYYLCQNFKKSKSSTSNLNHRPSMTFPDNDLKLKQSRHIRLFHNIDKTMFIILLNHYLLKISNEKPGAKVMISNLNNYLAICC